MVGASCGYFVDDSKGLGRRFDGIGGLSGGGATSKLLVNYPEPQRSEILDFLFKPNFGASLQILKVEIGGDGQSTDGTESSHMHESWDENYQRGYEWWLMVEAKKRNPAIKLYGLSWAFPGWVGHGSGNPYKFPNDTATYIIKWILGAKRVYNLDIDYIGIWNERNYDIVYVETLKSMLQKSGLGNIQVVVADGGWEVSTDVLKNPTFAAAVDIIGTHYPGTTTSNDSIKTNKPLWASEDYSTFNDNVGAGCWARILNQNYVNGFMTSTISWNLIASYYESLPYGRDGLMTAEEPWSGHYVVDNPIWVSAHTTQFANIGWNYLMHGYGVGHLDNGGSYVSLLSPDRKNFTMIIETMTHNHSVCIRPGLPPYKVVAQQAEFKLDGSMGGIEELHVWKTSLRYDGQLSNVFEREESIKPYLGMFTITLEPDQIYTLTTMVTGMKGSYADPPPSKPFPLPYIDTYESYAEFSEAFNFAPQIGVWEVRKSSSPGHGMVNRQVLLSTPIQWCTKSQGTINIGGSNKWSDVVVWTDVLIPSVNGSKGVFVSARVDRGGCDSDNAKGVFFVIYPNNNTFLVSTDFATKNVLKSGVLPNPFKLDTWYRLNIDVQGTDAFFLIDTTYLFHVNLPSNIKQGFVGYGTTSLGFADFDNLNIFSSSSINESPRKDFNVQPDVLPLFEIHESQRL